MSQTRKELLEILNEEDMIKIMFKDYLRKCSVGKIKELAKEYIERRKIMVKIKIVETTEKYDKDGKLVEKVTREETAEDDTVYTPSWTVP